MAMNLRNTQFMDIIGCPSRLEDKLNMSDAEKLNHAVFLMVFSQLYSLVVNSIDAEGETGGLDLISLKRALINLGCSAEFELFGVPFNLPCGNGATLTAQGYAKYLYGYTMNGKVVSIKCFVPHADTNNTQFDKFLTDSIVDFNIDATQYEGENGFLLKLNPMGVPLLPTIVYYASQISDTLRILETQRFWMRKPGTFFVDENSRKQLLKMVEDLNNNEIAVSVPRALIDGSKGIVPFQSFVFPATEHKETKDDVEFYKKEFLQIIGIDGNASPDKAANLTNDEVHADGKISSFNIHAIVDFLNEQQEMINEVLGTSLKWKVNENALNEGVKTLMGESEEDDGEVQDI